MKKIVKIVPLLLFVFAPTVSSSDLTILTENLPPLNYVKDGVLVGPSLPKFVEELGSSAEYVLGFSHWEPKPDLDYPGIKEFIQNYKKRYGEKPNYHAARGYDALQIMEAAVKHAGSFEPERIRDALASIRVETIAGPWKVNEQGLSNREGLTFQIQKGERVVVWPAHKAEARFLLMPKWEDRPKE